MFHALTLPRTSVATWFSTLCIESRIRSAAQISTIVRRSASHAVLDALRPLFRTNFTIPRYHARLSPSSILLPSSHDAT
ncbi:hypothetical protein CU665_04975 [Pseudomonas syringae pv. actinidifoliorum]|nr:hypothetical protein [Pseudomonas syringae pv. actinidifoliorum]